MLAADACGTAFVYLFDDGAAKTIDDVDRREDLAIQSTLRGPQRAITGQRERL